LSQVRNFAKYKQLKETLRFFEQQTSQLLLKLNPSGLKESKSNHRVKSKSSETETLRKFNDLIKVSQSLKGIF
jgi:hypothetical protein